MSFNLNFSTEERTSRYICLLDLLGLSLDFEILSLPEVLFFFFLSPELCLSLFMLCLINKLLPRHQRKILVTI